LFAERQKRTAEWEAWWDVFEKARRGPEPKVKDDGCTFGLPGEPASPTLRQVMSMHLRERFDYHGVDRYPDLVVS
jgi:hypothetical protein